MPVINSIAARHDEMAAWRRDFHAHPEIAFEEVRTSGLVAERLAAWGIEVHRGLGETGVVGVLRGRDGGGGQGGGQGGGGGGGRTIGLRADMDALPMTEENDLPYRSVSPGRFHGCGHDGHTTMLLGAARYLAETRAFDGTVHFIFQPAEEGRAGARRMIDDGLFERFPCDEVYALHNWPDLPAGTIGLRPGVMMAASDQIQVTVRGRGGHAAMPHKCIDPVVAAAHMITAFQHLVSRRTDPVDSAVVSITRVGAGTATNVVPEEAWLCGTARAFHQAMREQLEAGVRRVARGVADAFGVDAEIMYHYGYPPTVNHAEQTAAAARIAARIVGEANVLTDMPPVMGAEDFAYMLEACPGAYIWVGQGGGPSACSVHNPRYDFNDAILPIGASLLATLAESRLNGAMP